MKIREHSLSIETDELLGGEIKSGEASMSSLFSYDNGTTYYNPFIFLLVSRKSLVDRSKPLSLDDVSRAFRKFESSGKSFEQKFRFLLHQTTSSHEVRHFHDCLCTKIGIEDFTKTILFIDDIIKALHNIKFFGEYIKEPILQTNKENSTKGQHVDEIRKLVRLCRNFKIYRTLFNGDLLSATGPLELTDYDIIWYKFKLPMYGENQIEVPVYPATAIVGGEKKCYLQSLGFRAMTECQAVTWQNKYLRSFGKEYSATYNNLLRKKPVYTVLNAFLNKIYKNNNLNISNLGGDDILYESIDYSLHNGSLYNFFKKTTHPISILKDTISNLNGNKTPKSSNITSNSIELDNESIENLTNLPKEIFNWVRKYVWNESKDVITRSIKTFHFLSGEEHEAQLYFANIGKLPHPPYSLESDKLYSLMDSDAINELNKVLVPWIFVIEIVESLCAFSSDFKCPIAYRLHGQMYKHKEFHCHEFCEKSLPGGTCGHFVIGESLTKHVNCYWKELLINFALCRSK
ncbi:hypothetical protein [Marinifilum flexuosum]|uniref:Uncharacterized protein n=1 Tax=Marinifilum flexuosum TaxID=1117708 RepID=A0A419WEX0_9BACT|nr:hypothetical protein [Marinifilum flexuosum]RKD94044.1 hypothetical protein BXY64_4308 [Marinifilum flexuosum]